MTMHKSTNLEFLITLDAISSRDAITGSAPVIRLARESAGNDSCADPVAATDEIDAWARHAAATNGLGDAPMNHIPAVSPTSYELYQAAHAHRAGSLGEMLGAAIEFIGAILRQAYAGYRRYRRAVAIQETLHDLDDRTLHDLGFDRSEIRSVAAEMTGAAERTRVRALQSQRAGRRNRARA